MTLSFVIFFLIIDVLLLVSYILTPKFHILTLFVLYYWNQSTVKPPISRHPWEFIMVSAYERFFNILLTINYWNVIPSIRFIQANGPLKITKYPANNIKVVSRGALLCVSVCVDWTKSNLRIRTLGTHCDHFFITCKIWIIKPILRNFQSLRVTSHLCQQWHLPHSKARSGSHNSLDCPNGLIDQLIE